MADTNDQAETGELPPGFDGALPGALNSLRAAGWGEGDADDPHVPADLLELGEALKATEAGLL